MTVRRPRRTSRQSLISSFAVIALLFGIAKSGLPRCSAQSEVQAAPSKPPLAGGAGPLGELPKAPAEDPPRGSEAVVASSVHVTLGVPRDADPSDDHFLDEGSFVISYSPSKRVANWVAWRLDRSFLGNVRRRDDFRPDLSLPARFYRVNERDYRNSGYDRGHLCPSADRDHSPVENSRTFLFTNMHPQLHELNAGPWERLEAYARERAVRGQVLYVVAGGVFSAPFRTIGNGVAVPAASYKIIVFLSGGQQVSDVSEQTEVLAVMMPNQAGVGARDWTAYLTSVDAVEEATGYDFLTAVPERVQRVIEARTDRP